MAWARSLLATVIKMKNGKTVLSELAAEVLQLTSASPALPPVSPAPTSARSKGGVQEPLVKFTIQLFSAEDSPAAEVWKENPKKRGEFHRNYELAADPVFEI